MSDELEFPTQTAAQAVEEMRMQIVYDSALLEAAGLVCEQCAKGIKFAETHPEMWWHLTANGGFINCKSREIHERLAYGKEPKACLKE